MATNTIDPEKTSLKLDIVVERTSTPREGRENQVYSSKDNARLVAGGVILDKEKKRVLLISSSKHKDRWIIPKGGIEKDEIDNFAKAALRETWEESGAICEIVKKLPSIPDHRKDLKIDNSKPLKYPLCEFHFYQMTPIQLEQEWPESNSRLRRWANYEEAKHELLKSKRPELLHALDVSDIVKNDAELLEYDSNNHMIDAELEIDDYDHIEPST